MPHTERVDYFQETLARFDAASEADGSTLAWAQLVRTTLAMLRERSNTAVAEKLVLSAEELWSADQPEAATLERLRVQVWEYLDAKNGTSTTIRDTEDRVLRCLIGMLFPFRNRGRVADSLDWHVQMGITRSAP